MELWTFVWVFISLLVLITILESIHRRAKRKRAAIEHQMLHEQFRNQPYAVYTIPSGTDTSSPIFTTNRNHQFMKSDDLPPKYEDIIVSNTVVNCSTNANNGPFPNRVNTTSNEPCNEPNNLIGSDGRPIATTANPTNNQHF